MKLTKYIIRYCLPGLAVASLAACNKLEEYNPGGSTGEAVWTNPEGFVTLVNAAYNYQRDWYGQSENGLFVAETGTDLWFNQNKAGYANQLTRYEGLTGSQGNPNINSWRAIWPAINLCNAGIGRIDAAGFTTEADKNKRLGELHFLRGFYYWHVVEQWGGVMLLTTETNGPVVTATRSSVEDFYKLIIADLEFAAANLPDTWGSEYSRATRKSALGFLARAYLSRAYYFSAGSAEATASFTKARDYANQLITNGGTYGVSMYGNYADVFLAANNKNNKEALYVVSTSSNPVLNYDSRGNRSQLWFQTKYDDGRKPGVINTGGLEYGNTQEQRIMPTRALLDLYAQNDPRYDATFQEVWRGNTAYTWTATDAATYKKDASVIGKTIRVGVDTAVWVTRQSVPDKASRPYVVIDRDSTYNSGTGAIYGGVNFPRMKKFNDPAGTRIGTLDFIVMRLAEMYMISAEAEMQLNNAGAAAQKINELRARGGSLPADRTVSAADITLDFILDERAREFAGEYQRWFDLKRTRKIIDRVNRLNPDIVQLKTDANPNRFYLRPIPQGDLDAMLNGKEFGQNPGY
jgi:hypothetical protein